MNTIRKNNEQESDILTMLFKIEPVVHLFDLLKGLIGIGLAVAGLFLLLNISEASILGVFFIIAGVITFFYNTVGTVLKSVGAKNSVVTVSNQRIYGKYGPYIIKKTFSYKLDEINNVELNEFLGSHSILINFQDGKGPKSAMQVRYGDSASVPMMGLGILKLSSVKNYQESYDKLSDILKSLKSNVDLETDIQMEKVSAENRKADAFEKIANNLNGGIAAASHESNSSSDYIDEIRRLKSLLDDGIINQEEFDREKAEILAQNHK